MIKKGIFSQDQETGTPIKEHLQVNRNSVMNKMTHDQGNEVKLNLCYKSESGFLIKSSVVEYFKMVLTG